MAAAGGACALIVALALGFMGAGPMSSGGSAGGGEPDPAITVRDGESDDEAADDETDDRATFRQGEPEIASADPGAALDQPEFETALRAAGWPDALHGKAMAVAGCESGWNPTSIGHVGERGLFQIHPVHNWRFRQEFGSDADPFDPEQNAAVALAIWDRFGWDPWSCQDAGS